MEEFVNFREVLTPSGVYILLRQGVVVYVGKSKNLFSRLSKHYTNMSRVLQGKPAYGQSDGPPIMFDDVRVKFMPVDMLDMAEVTLIQRYLPKHNGHHNVPQYDLSHLPAFQELLKKARRHKTPTYARLPIGTVVKSDWKPPQPIYPPLRAMPKL